LMKSASDARRSRPWTIAAWRSSVNTGRRPHGPVPVCSLWPPIQRIFSHFQY
jgi:hypothetical protein